MTMVRRACLAVLGLILLLALVLAVMLGTMRLGWWNPSYESVKAQQATSPSRFVMVGDVKLHMRDEGSGPVIVMLHSSMTNLRLWDAWADRLKDRYRVIRLDWPPYGLSVDPNPSTGMQGIVELLERFVDQQKLGTFTLVGSSSGATIAVLYAAKHPGRVNALALSTLPLAAPPPTEFSRWEQAMIWTHETLVPNYYPKFYYRSVLASLYGVAERLKPETVDWYYGTNNLPGGFARVRDYYNANKKAVWSKGAEKEAAAIRVPVLLQWGDLDPVLKAPVADKAVAQFTNTKVTLIHYPDVSHYPMIELPEKTGEDLEAWLDKTVAAQPAGAAPSA
jgi:pimeloyl-ACP methyl ester carboxylesterase